VFRSARNVRCRTGLRAEQGDDGERVLRPPCGPFLISQGMGMFATTPLERHYAPEDPAVRIAYALARFLRFFADAFFARRAKRG